MASVQGNFGIPGYGNVNVSFGKQIENAKHVGLGESKPKVQAKNEPAAEPARAEAPAAPPPPQGVSVFAQPDGGEVWTTQSGVKANIDSMGEVSNISILGEGQINKGSDGKYTVTGSDGSARPVSDLRTPEGEFLGYSYEKADKTQVYVHLDDLSVAYHSPDRTVWQEVDASGGNLIHSLREFQHTNGKKETLETKVYVKPNGEYESDGYSPGLEMHPGKMRFLSPRNFPMEVDFVKPLHNLATTQQAGPAQPQENVPQTPPQAPPPANAPVAVIHGTDIDVELPSQVNFKRDQAGQTCIQLRNGMTMVYADGGAIARETMTGTNLPVTTDDYVSRDGRREKTFLFKDTNGNSYRMFQQSLDFIVESADKKVVQHVLPNGAILGQVAGDDGRLYKFEVGPRGNYVSDAGLNFHQKSGDKDLVYVPGADGQPKPLQLPYGIPENQSNAGMMADIHGVQNFPMSGQILGAFQAQNNHNNAPPVQGNFNNPQAPQGPQGPQGPAPHQPPPPMPPEMDPTVFPRPGMPQPPVSPSFMQRLKYFFSGNTQDLNAGPPPIPPDMRGGPSGHWGTAMGPNGNSTQPFDFSGNQVGHGLGPGAPRQSASPNYGDAYGGQQTWGGQMPDGSPPPMPGTPNYYGSLNTNPMIANFQRQFEHSNRMMMGQLAVGQVATLGLTAMTAMSSLSTGFSFARLFPSSLFFNPMSML